MLKRSILSTPRLIISAFITSILDNTINWLIVAVSLKLKPFNKFVHRHIEAVAASLHSNSPEFGGFKILVI